MEENLRQRAKKQLLRVTLPDGKVICHKSATMTFVEALQAIGSENYEKINLEVCHLPFLSKEVYPRFEEWMKPIADGWYANMQSDTRTKCLQLTSIAKQLGLNIIVETGSDFITSDEKIIQKKSTKDQKLLVKFPDGEYIGGENPIDTYLESIWKLGVDEIFRKGVEYSGKKLITTTKQYNGQVQVGNNRWLVVPPQTKDKYKMLRVLGAILRQKLEINII